VDAARSQHAVKPSVVEGPQRALDDLDITGLGLALGGQPAAGRLSIDAGPLRSYEYHQPSRRTQRRRQGEAPAHHVNPGEGLCRQRDDPRHQVNEHKGSPAWIKLDRRHGEQRYPHQAAGTTTTPVWEHCALLGSGAQQMLYRDTGRRWR